MSSISQNPTNSSVDDVLASIHSFKDFLLQPPSAILPTDIKEEWSSSSSSSVLLTADVLFTTSSSTNDVTSSPVVHRTPESTNFPIEFIPPEATPRSIIPRPRRLSSMLSRQWSSYRANDYDNSASRTSISSGRSLSPATAPSSSSSSTHLQELQDVQPPLLRGPFEPGPLLCLEDYIENKSMQEDIIDLPDEDAMLIDEWLESTPPCTLL